MIDRPKRYAVLFFVCFTAVCLFSSISCAEPTLEELASPDSGDDWFLVGNIFFDNGEYSDAIGSWHNAMFLTPALSADCWYNIGLAYASLGMYQEAIGSWINCLEYNPFFAAAYDNIATAYLFLGMPQNSLFAYEQAIALSPEEEKYRQDRDSLISNLKDMARSPEYDFFPSQGWFEAGKILYDENEYEKAREAWTKAGLMDPAMAGNSWKNIAITYMEQQDYEKAVNAWLMSLEALTLPNSYNDIGFNNVYISMPDMAKKKKKKALLFDPGNEIYATNKKNLLELYPDLAEG
jgi:tetratricopeptide (TPR) repeat protein